MKVILFRSLCIASLILGDLVEAFAQGTLAFNTRVPSANIDAPALFLNGEPVGAGFIAQLYGGPAGTPISDLKPIFPLSNFRKGYVIGPPIEMSDIAPGESGTFVVRAYDGSTWETSTCRGESNPVTIQLSGGALPPAYLVGLQSFKVDCIPEPGTLALFALGTGGLCVAGARRSYRLKSLPVVECSQGAILNPRSTLILTAAMQASG